MDNRWSKYLRSDFPQGWAAPALILKSYRRTSHSRASTTIDAGPIADNICRLWPGEIDPDPETKPARPDSIEDGLSHLSLCSTTLMRAYPEKEM